MSRFSSARSAPRGSARLRLGMAGCSVALVLCTPGSALAATRLSDGLESGAPTGWSVTSNVTVASTYARSGVYGARLVTTPQTSGFLNWSDAAVTQGQRYARISASVKIATCDCTQNVGVLNVKNVRGVNHFDLWRAANSGKFRWDLYSGNTAFSTMSATVGQWYFIEVLIDFGGSGGTTYTARVRINGIDQPSITSGSQAGSTVKSAWFSGPTTGLTNTKHYDDLAFAVGSTPFAFTR